PRPNWENGQFGSAYVSDFGIVGQRAHVNVGSDLFFMSADGLVRSANMSRAEQGKWSRSPLSFEVKKWLKFQELALAEYTSITYFRNKVFVTANPFRTRALTLKRLPAHDYAFAGMVALEFDNISTIQGGSP